MVVRLDFESVRLFCPDARDVFIGCQAAQGLEPTCMVVGVDEELKVLPELVVVVVVVSLDGRVLDRPGYSFRALLTAFDTASTFKRPRKHASIATAVTGLVLGSNHASNWRCSRMIGQRS